MSRAPWALVGCIALAGACGGGSAPEPTYGALGGAVALVGDTPLVAALVGDEARASALTPRAALRALVEDALAAQGAAAQGLDRTPAVRWASAATLGRAVPRRLWDEARAQGSPSDDELALVQVVHAVVLRPHSLPGSRALFTARAVADAVATARTSDEFQERARVATTGVRASIEALPPFDAAGHTADGNALDPDFTAAAFALHAVGETSPIVETTFGWHVIRLVSRVPPPKAELAERRIELGAAVLDVRARSRLFLVLHERREHTRVEVSEAADELLAQAVATR